MDPEFPPWFGDSREGILWIQSQNCVWEILMREFHGSEVKISSGGSPGGNSMDPGSPPWFGDPRRESMDLESPTVFSLLRSMPGCKFPGKSEFPEKSEFPRKSASPCLPSLSFWESGGEKLGIAEGRKEQGRESSNQSLCRSGIVLSRINSGNKSNQGKRSWRSSWS